MATTVKNLMATFSHRPQDFDTSPTLSRKEWTHAYAAFDPASTTCWPPEIPAINELLELTPSRANHLGLETLVHELNSLPQLISSEADVTRDFGQSVIIPVALAFSGNSASSRLSNSGPVMRGAPALWQQSQIGSTSASDQITVDFQLTMHHLQRDLEMPAIIGEMKKSRAIAAREWLGQAEPSARTVRLQRELRGYNLFPLTYLFMHLVNWLRYAHQYECPHIFVYDAGNMVIVQFRASSPEDIASRHCPIDVCVVPRDVDPFLQSQCTMQYALYKLALAGWRRLCSTLDSKVVVENQLEKVKRARTHLVLDGFSRKYTWWSGRPYWVDDQNRRYGHHPNGYSRDFVIRYHGEESKGYFVWLDQQGRGVDDTLNCFVSHY
jgi:hypothetical protein